MSSRVCSARKTKLRSDVYLRKELDDIARKSGMRPVDIKKLNKKQLCRKLRIKWVQPKKKVTKVTNSYKSRSCGTKSKLNPNAYTKPELVELAMSELGYSKSKALRKTKDEICVDLVYPPPKRKTPKKKSLPSQTKTVKRKSPPKKDDLSSKYVKPTREVNEYYSTFGDTYGSEMEESYNSFEGEENGYEDFVDDMISMIHSAYIFEESDRLKIPEKDVKKIKAVERYWKVKIEPRIKKMLEEFWNNSKAF